ncbi:hypothetical protein TrST_g13858 [Triparma strigata]|uniref:Uncharacterized protein n=1 Tax=Triparma strigata TaxID=1606541 RepID=A0A9W7AYE6_9STRA|nr:hypothetical protein TrST_g13858 [Triparma strigata]
MLSSLLRRTLKGRTIIHRSGPCRDIKKMNNNTISAPGMMRRRTFASANKKQEMTALSTPVSWKMLGLTTVLSFTAVSYYKIQHTEKIEATNAKVTTTGTAMLGGPWTLIDTETGDFVSDKSYSSTYTILYFGFAHCPDICPSELRKLSKVLESLEGKKIDCKGLFITVDGARDSVTNLCTYSKDFHPSISYLTGTPKMVKDMAKLYRVYVSKADEVDGDYLVDHSIVLYFVKKDGSFGEFFTQSMKAGDIVKKIEAIVKKDEKS